MTDDPTQRFSGRVESYVRYRPGYPSEALGWLLKQSGLGSPGVIADLGSGTGIFTEALLRRGHRVYAVEPNGPMRAYAEQALGGFEGFVSVNGAAESTTLERQSVDLVTAAQAFHWFMRDDAKRELARVLKPDGSVALVWNDRITAGDAFHAEYESLLKNHATDYERVNHQNLDDADFRRFFEGGFAFQSFGNAQRFDLIGLIGRAESSSYMPGPGDAGNPEMVAALGALFDRHAVDGAVSIGYRTTVRLGRVV